MHPSDLSLRDCGLKPELVPHKLNPLLLFEHGKTWRPSTSYLTGIPTELPSMLSEPLCILKQSWKVLQCELRRIY